MKAAGFTISGVNHPICPVMLGDARLASCMADDMLKRGKEARTKGLAVGPKRKEGGTLDCDYSPLSPPYYPF